MQSRVPFHYGTDGRPEKAPQNAAQCHPITIKFVRAENSPPQSPLLLLLLNIPEKKGDAKLNLPRTQRKASSSPLSCPPFPRTALNSGPTSFSPDITCKKARRKKRALFPVKSCWRDFSAPSTRTEALSATTYYIRPRPPFRLINVGNDTYRTK